MPMNQFTSQQEVIFITYEDVIKTSKVYILRKLLNEELKLNYSKSIDYSKIEQLTDKDIMKFVIASTNKNILRYFSLDVFDYDATYKYLLSEYPDVYNDSTLMSIGKSIYILLYQKFVKRIYIYTEDYDERIHKDIFNLYDKQKIVYTTGDFSSAIREINKTDAITSFMLNDIDYIQKLIDLDVIKFTNILLANYGYNYKPDENNAPILKINDVEKILKDKLCKFALFTPDDISTK